MNSRLGMLMACVVAGITVNRGFATEPIPVRSLLPVEKKVADAARIEDPALREVALRKAIEDGLSEASYEKSYLVASYLSANDRWIDLRPFEDLIGRYHGGSRHDNDGERWVQGIKWRYLRRADRLRVCRAAIEQGQAMAPGGMIVNRYVAMRSVGTYGLDELAPLVNKYFGGLPSELKDFTPEMIAVKAALLAGGEDREDCAQRAAARLGAMSDEDFKRKMDNEKDFADVVLGAGGEVQFVCARNPFTGWVNPGCDQIHRIYDRQEALDKRIQAENATEGIRPEISRRPEPGRPTWLQLLRSASNYDVRYLPR